MNPSAQNKPLYSVYYIAPDGKETVWNDVLDFDELKKSEIKKDSDKKKGSWFAKQGNFGHFRF